MRASSQRRSRLPGVVRRASAPRLAVRRATLRDAEEIAELRIALLLEEVDARAAALRPDARARALELTRGQLADPSQAFFVATVAQRIVGMLRCSVARSSPLLRSHSYCLVTTAYVRPEFRRRGVLSRLVQAVVAWCSQRGLDELRLQCKVDNEIGLAAWQALGFREVALVLRRSAT
ncbi:MAG TPA: GNAT family N-acetyltransferase [Gemmatimonadaceae bacterium]|nr:GNAT family N-acetyltransferase [Gemmatimonadaceae bacterium]